MPVWIPFLQKKCNQDNMQYLCVPFTFQSISAYLIHIVPPRFKQKDWKCCSSLAKTGDTYFNFFFSMAHKREVACLASEKISWIRMTWVPCALGQGNCNISPLYRLTVMQVHIHANTHRRARAHTHTLKHTHFLAVSLSWNIIMYYHAKKATFWNTNENTELDHIIHWNQNLCGQ